ncbi:hypothetical protein D9613_008511 [Agrocybe pediades]|uniref:Uncharacterized protein n=1 Tax=Agrocybe pediades TaxID=84607 RepID=A0A8H4QSI6_9AGAR|nr:hypothetical protein D9613_008511 [Agrocybe pediades]
MLAIPSLVPSSSQDWYNLDLHNYIDAQPQTGNLIFQPCVIQNTYVSMLAILRPTAQTTVTVLANTTNLHDPQRRRAAFDPVTSSSYRFPLEAASLNDTPISTQQ